MVLDWDLHYMKRFIKGEPTYFRNRVRQAFRDNAKIEDVTFPFRGRDIKGVKLTIVPFEHDANAERMEIFAAKTYEFIVSDEVPGGVYQIRIFVPNRAVAVGPAQHFIDEKVTFVDYKPGGAQK
jgi:hypothetical protein